MIFAAVVLAVQQSQRKAADLTEEKRQTGGNLLLNANSAELSEVVGSKRKEHRQNNFRTGDYC